MNTVERTAERILREKLGRAPHLEATKTYRQIWIQLTPEQSRKADAVLDWCRRSLGLPPEYKISVAYGMIVITKGKGKNRFCIPGR